MNKDIPPSTAAGAPASPRSSFGSRGLGLITALISELLKGHIPPQWRLTASSDQVAGDGVDQMRSN